MRISHTWPNEPSTWCERSIYPTLYLYILIRDIRVSKNRHTHNHKKTQQSLNSVIIFGVYSVACFYHLSFVQPFHVRYTGIHMYLFCYMNNTILIFVTGGGGGGGVSKEMSFDISVLGLLDSFI